MRTAAERGEPPAARQSVSASAGTLMRLAFFVCPLLFFTDLTRNPYFTQIALLNISVLAAAGMIAMRGFRMGLRLPRTPVDYPWLAWLGACALSWVIAYFGHQTWYREAMLSEGKRVFLFTLVNAWLPFYLAMLLPRWEDAEDGPWIFVALAGWGALWAFYPALRSAGASGSVRVMDHLWDPYGALLWAAGAGLALWAARRGNAEDYIRLAMGVGGLAAAYGIMEYFNVEWIWPKVLNPYGGRAVSTFGNPNFLSSFLVVLFPLALLRTLGSKGGARLAYGALFLLYEASLLASLTRSSWAGALAGICLLLFLPRLREIIRRNPRAAAALAAPALALILLWPQSRVEGYTPSVWGRILELRQIATTVPAPPETADLPAPEGPAPYGPWHQRLLIWSCAWQMLLENPWTGKGWGLFELFYPFYQGPLLAAVDVFRSLRTHANNTHNEVLEIASQTGLLGLGITLWFWAAYFASVLAFLRANPRAPDWTSGLAAGAGGMLVDNLLNVSLHFAVPAFLHYWCCGMVLGYIYREASPSRDAQAVLRPLEERRNSDEDFRRLARREERGVPGGHVSDEQRRPTVKRPADFGGIQAVTALVRPERRALAPGAVLALAALAACLLGGWEWIRQWKREVHYFMGFKLMRVDNPDRAVGMLERAYAWHPREVNANYELGNSYARAGRFERAVWAYQEALRANAGYDEIYFNLGTVLGQRLGRWEEAERHYRTAAWINPTSREALGALLARYLQDPKKNIEAARALLEKARRIFPQEASHPNNLGYLLTLEGKLQEASLAYASALRIDPDFALAEKNLRATLAQLRTGEPLLEALESLRELEARVVRKELGAGTLELARRSARDFPEVPKVRFYLGSLLFVHGLLPPARSNLEWVLQREPQHLSARLNLGLLLEKQGERLAASREFKTILQTDPANSAARERLRALGVL